MSKEPVILDYDEIIIQTGSAILLSMYEQEVWIPNSVVIDLAEEELEVTLPEWFALKVGLI